MPQQMTTVAGEDWSDDMEQLLILLLHRRFGRNTRTTAGALARLLKSDSSVAHVNIYLDRKPGTSVTVEIRRVILA